MKLAGFSYIYNADKFDIPIIESVKSVIDVVDQFVLTVCYSEDNTLEMCKQLQAKYPNKIKLLERNWVIDFHEISSLANWTKDHIDVDVDVCFSLQADEVMHEKDLDELVSLPQIMKEQNKTACRWNYLHFLNSQTTFPFCYSSLVRVVKYNTMWNVTGDGVQFVFGNGLLPENMIYNSNIEIFHYGKMKSPEKGFQKEISFQNLFTSLGFPDKRMAEMQNKFGKEYCDYLYLFKEHVVNKTIKKFDGTHPKVMEKRIADFKAGGYEQFVSMMEENLKIEDSSSNPLEQTLKRKVMD